PQLEIVPLKAPPRAAIQVPGSKSITNRALVLSALTALSERDILLDGASQSDDTEVMVHSLRRLGYTVEPVWPGGYRRSLGIHAAEEWPAASVRVTKVASTKVVPAVNADL